MKTCPFCAEEIQDTAIVCKHCRRDLTPDAKPKARRWRVILVVVGGLVAAFVLALFFAPDSPEMTAFKARRTAWHQKCDQYINIPNNQLDADGRVCLQEFQALQAYAKQQGW